MSHSEKMHEILRLFWEKWENMKGEPPKGHETLQDLEIGIYVSGDTLEKTKDYFQVKACGIILNITGDIEWSKWPGIDNIRPVMVGKFLDAVLETLQTGESMKKRGYKTEDFLGETDVRVEERTVTKEVVKEIDNPVHKTKAAILDKLLFEREAVFREQQC